ncbi:TPM domain-containing protein [Paraburkholderia phenazinium]|uniref:TLP18.3, Psb32 and MOLO-1 founding protein of phosphatase n=1 Tax=Paraburkholderia phenazinium TaxID=60549 RepID=A0A1G8JRF8_9BURK|nr:TPM domain-containing protein [Paraburkholderia phenazinium]SDI33776.1 TLP18.3, Psb32 and MOLO-1 founding protein of phosphatase [Paraburkholderia phenazinium]
MVLERVLRHLLVTRWHVNRAFPADTLRAIEKAIRENHRTHVGQIRFAVEGALHIGALLEGMSAQERAIDVFSELRVWDTEHNNGVLIYLLLADHDVEIVADRGAHARINSGEWDAICRQMEAAFKLGDYRAGVLRGIEEVTALLKRHFPAQQETHDELPSKPAVL